MQRICILDYGSGNVKSVYNLFSEVSGNVTVSNAPADIEAASHIVLPGVGAFGAAMRRIGETLPLDVLERVVREQGKPFLGICVGMQVLADTGHEFGETPGLGWIGGTVRQLQPGTFPLPHIGWNNIDIRQPSPLLEGLDHAPDFYYVHSFAFDAADPADVLATTDYGQQFTGVVGRGNIYGVQFHPEKSQRAGMRLVKNFLAIP
ncbi:imidazole glycerol phosphate synthase subunit HisH [Pseudoduganella albidiflava]|uniref:Imidazole glycerol phosphate synthase subunit HisH n=1 Tax=Pseudoduganella albidiflava TaxID=321983 RepID=A0A411X6G6_9BURK|nr:imidazole glycerol phosphate synthase subunit HisH [Pseudoduganella albidiflava]QBI04640.1 imidazole glycerol phosphate synthase subunit HisH [Pseudoduganella albidiflava]GGY28868.1 imidazole glycerol phosphate synthase subunit HisH [Pseudoduganella albidiflava]